MATTIYSFSLLILPRSWITISQILLFKPPTPFSQLTLASYFTERIGAIRWELLRAYTTISTAHKHLCPYKCLPFRVCRMFTFLSKETPISCELDPCPLMPTQLYSSLSLLHNFSPLWITGIRVWRFLLPIAPVAFFFFLYCPFSSGSLASSIYKHAIFFKKDFSWFHFSLYLKHFYSLLWKNTPCSNFLLNPFQSSFHSDLPIKTTFFNAIDIVMVSNHDFPLLLEPFLLLLHCSLHLDSTCS